MSTPFTPPIPPPPGMPSDSLPPSVVKENRGLLTIIGVVLCLLGTVSLGGGGLSVFLLLALPTLKTEWIGNATTASPEDRAALETLTSVLEKWVEPFLLPLAATTALTTLVTAILLVWMGIGTIQARRWARKLLLASGWAWCGLMVFQFICFLAMLPGMTAWGEKISRSGGGAPTPPGPLAMAVAVQVLVNLITYAASAAPGIALILIFSLRGVRLTCDQLDPGRNWTDRVPLQVLPLWLILAGWFVQVVTLLPLGPALHALCHNLGLPVPPLAFSLSLIATLYLGLCVALLARLHPLSWWLIFTGSAAGLVAICLFHLRTDFSALLNTGLSLIPLPEAERTQLQKGLSPALRQSIAELARDFWIVQAISGGAFLAFLIWLKRFFRPEPGPA